MKSIQQVVTEFIRDIMNLDITEGIGTYQKKGQACFNEVICRLTEARIREVDTYGSYVRKGAAIYKIPLKKCPVCGDAAGGKIRIKIVNGIKCYRCSRDKDHKWKFEYYQIHELI